MRLRREHLGQRRADRLLPGPRAREIQIRVHRETHGRKHPAETGQFRAIDSASLAQPNPGLDSALLPGGAVLIDDAPDPRAAHFALGTVREYRAVLKRNIRLVIETIGDPAANLPGRELALVHHDVKPMMNVIAPLHRAKLPLEFLAAPRAALRHRHRSTPRGHDSANRPALGSGFRPAQSPYHRRRLRRRPASARGARPNPHPGWGWCC